MSDNNERRSKVRIPTEEECGVICARFDVSRQVIAHSTLVAELARMLAVLLNNAGLSLNLALILAAGRLHDIARAKPDHAGAGAKILAEMGYPEVSAVVAKHMDIQSRGPSVDEADLIYFADKCVEEDRLVSLDERFQESLVRHKDRPDVVQKIAKRFENAKMIGERMEAILKYPVADLIQRYARNVKAAAASAHEKKLYLVRHGAVQSPGEPRRFIGQLDLPLNEEGTRQAEALAKILEDVPFSAIFCSDLKRSLDTARIIAKPHGLPCFSRPSLREISLGRWDGLTFEEVRRKHPEEFNARRMDIVHYQPPEGESFLDCALRVIPAFYEILNSTRGNILIVGHAGVNRIVLSQALGWPMDCLLEIDQEYGCLNMVVYRNYKFDVKLLNASLSNEDLFRIS